MAESLQKIGVFVAGGPAPGINAVIKGIVQAADIAGARVFGFLEGARGLVEGRFVRLTRQMVEDIHALGGSVLRTSRYRIDDDGRDMARILENLRGEGIEALISIGGEGTAKLADVLRQAGIRIVHVPKTIDNDIAGVAQTFGFDSAVNAASQMLSAIKLDAEAAGSWFVVEIMGRYTGHLALEAGIAAGCTRVLIPEEGPIPVDDLVSLVQTRARCGQHWGVILVAESAHFGEGYITRDGRLGGVCERLAEQLEQGCQAQERRISVRTSNLGYFLRCTDPTGFDRSYAAQLGLGAAQFILDPARSGQMVSVVDDRLHGVSLETVAGVAKAVDLQGIRYQALRAISEYESARVEVEDQERALRNCAVHLNWLDRHADADTVRDLAMRLGVSLPDLLESLEDLQAREAQPEPGHAPFDT
ncbi:MAG: 6-phosphofructokinase [Actinomycetota bacterium]